MRCWIPCLAMIITLLATSFPNAAEPTPVDLEFFETKVRPLLHEHCFSCHSAQAKSVKGGLRLDSRIAAIRGGESGAAVVVGQPNESRLIQAIRWQSLEMPPNGKLREDQIETLIQWIQRGAPWPESQEPDSALSEKTYDWPQLQQQHWAWRPIVSPEVPKVQDTTWPQNEIDRFLLAKIEAVGLHPNPPAQPRALLRRIRIDLTGLPPSTAEVQHFLIAFADNRKQAVLDLVDRLLRSPEYGERWGRHWLDVARYSDLDNAAMPNAWRYRDWVVSALNRDLPFDEFVRGQIAGDLINPDLTVATGFLALGPTYISDGGDPDATAQARSETLDDRVDTVTRGLMGLTVACCRCHDHRFDPFPQLDYYSLAGIFNNTQNRDVPQGKRESIEAWDLAEKAIRDLEKQIVETKARIANEKREPTPDEKSQLESGEPELERLKKNLPPKYDLVHAIADIGNADMTLAIRGNLRRPGPSAPRRFLRILGGAETPLFQRGSGRLDLAEALTSATNPLTARVMVNRVWQQHFGLGLVRTPSNFGLLGEKPTHPELLDWLASRFQGKEAADFGWSLKKLHRTILLSSAYQMASSPNPQAMEKDGDNRLVWRMNPRRLDVESWRDSILTFTGELEGVIGGPPIDDIGASSRRTLYAAVSRNGDRFSSDGFLRLFDFPVPRATSEGRTSSVVPQQSLFLMNSPFMAERAKRLATRLHREANTESARIRLAYELLFARPVTTEEEEVGLDFLQSKSASTSPLSLWEQYAQVLLSASEVMYVE